MSHPEQEIATRQGVIVEGQTVDFKSRIDLKDNTSKVLIIQAAVAFLNANAASIYVGVREAKKHGFERFEPYDGDADEVCRQLQSILLDGIDPKPIGVVVEAVNVEGGFILDVKIPDLRMRPYQAKGTGAFHIRTGRQNTPLRRDSIRAMFTSFAEYQSAAAALMAREEQAIAGRSPGLPKHAVTLHIAIVPGEHFEQEKAIFTGREVSGHPVGFQHWHDVFQIFTGCQGGFESLQRNLSDQPICRLFVSDDWLVHSLTAFPFVAEEGSGRVTLYELNEKLAAHLKNIESLLEKLGVRGPFAVLLKVDGLQNDPRIAWLFANTTSRSLPSARRVSRVDDEGLVKLFSDLVISGSKYGSY